MTSDWPFADPKYVAVFTLRRILKEGQPILHVCHDEEDGGWQFLDGGPATNDQAMLVSLKEMVVHDPAIQELADLPLVDGHAIRARSPLGARPAGKQRPSGVRQAAVAGAAYFSFRVARKRSAAPSSSKT